jgi:hypothetical protein
MKRLFVRVLIVMLLVGSSGVLFAASSMTSLAQPGAPSSIVYTADALDTNEDGVVNAADNDIMFSIQIGANPEDGRLRLAGGPPASAAYPRLSHNSEIILCHAFRDSNGDGITSHETDTPYLATLNIDGTDVTPLITEETGGVLEADFSPDEAFMIFAFINEDTNGDGNLTTADTRRLAMKELGMAGSEAGTASELVSDSEIVVLTGDDITISRPKFWTDTMVVFEAVRIADGRQGVYAYDMDAGQTVMLSQPDLDFFNPQFTFDSSRIAAEVKTDTGRRVWVYDAATATWLDAMPDDSRDAMAPSLSPDGDWLAMAVATDTGTDVVINTGAETISVASTDGTVDEVVFSPGGDSVAFAATFEDDQTLLVVASAEGGAADIVTPVQSNVVDFVWASS